MAEDWKVKVLGLQKAQAAMLKAIAAVQPQGVLDAATKQAAIAAHRYAVIVTHQITGTLKASHRIQRKEPAYWVIDIDPSFVNPKTGARPKEYGVYEEARGDTHAFYRRTYEHGHVIMRPAIAMLKRGLP